MKSITIACLALVASFSLPVSADDGDVIGDLIARRFALSSVLLSEGVDYDVISGVVVMRDMYCLVNSNCSNATITCKYVGATSTCYVCQTGYAENYCVPRPGWTDGCGATESTNRCGLVAQGTCAIPPGGTVMTCIAGAFGPGRCSPNICGGGS